MTQEAAHETMVLVKDGKEGLIRIGACVHNRVGWRFIPYNAVNTPSRKHWESAEKCIPRWANKIDGSRLVPISSLTGEAAKNRDCRFEPSNQDQSGL